MAIMNVQCIPGFPTARRGGAMAIMNVYQGFLQLEGEGDDNNECIPGFPTAKRGGRWQFLMIKNNEIHTLYSLLHVHCITRTST